MLLTAGLRSNQTVGHRTTFLLYILTQTDRRVFLLKQALVFHHRSYRSVASQELYDTPKRMRNYLRFCVADISVVRA